MKLAVFQTDPALDGVTMALRRLNDAGRQAGAHAADLLMTPEAYLGGYALGVEGARAAAMTTDGPSLQEVAEIARRWGIAILVGFPERTQDGVASAVHLIDRTGTPRLHYRRTHLAPGLDREQFVPGDTLSPVAEIFGWKLAVATGHDLAFPEVTRDLALRGAEIVLAPLAAKHPSAGLARRTVPVRAQENDFFLAAANYVGIERHIRYGGCSTVAGPDGETIAVADSENADLLIVQLDHDALMDWRKASDHRRDRRTQLYAPVPEPCG